MSKRHILGMVLSTLMFVTPTVVYAETPPCECSTSSALLTTSEGLECLTLTNEALDVCYGNDAVIRVTNTCEQSVTLLDIPVFGESQSEDLIIAPGDEGGWQQSFSPTLGYEGDTSVGLTWAAQLDEATEHFVALDFVGSCAVISSSVEGCQGSSHPLTLWSCLLALMALVLLRRSRPRHDTPQR